MAWLNGHCVRLANDTLAFVRGRPGRSVTSAPHKCLSVRMFREGFRPWWEKSIENKQVLFLNPSSKDRGILRKNTVHLKYLFFPIYKHCFYLIM